MRRYISTFYSHFGAVRFSRELKACNISVVLAPVPRFLSSSCGTCAEFEYDADLSKDEDHDRFLSILSHPEEIEQLVEVT